MMARKTGRTSTVKITTKTKNKVKPTPIPDYLKPLKNPYKTKLIISSKAELKIRIAMEYAKWNEVMWFGELKRNKKGEFILKDVLFPPQENEGAFVTTKDDKFPKWFHNHVVKKGKSKTMRLHGHTHPYFTTNPSAIDIAHVATYLQETKTFFIQLIMSNSFEPTCILYTMDGKQDLKIEMEQSKKVKKVLEKVMHKEESWIKYGHQQTRGLLYPDEDDVYDEYSYYWNRSVGVKPSTPNHKNRYTKSNTI